MADFTSIESLEIEIDEEWGHCDLTAKCNVQFYEADRSTGFAGGFTVEIISANMGGLELSRDQLVTATSEASIKASEELLAERAVPSDFLGEAA